MRITKTQQAQLDLLLDRALPNHITGPDRAAYGGKMFETYGPERDFVLAHAQKFPERVATLLLDCDGTLYLVSGWHFVNRFGYLVFSYDVPEFEVPVC